MRDSKDDHLLELAVASNSKHIVTFYISDFRGVEKFGVRAVTVQEYLKLTGIMK